MRNGRGKLFSMMDPELSKQLIPWFEKTKRKLPWRENRDRYRVWVSEVMLQQTRVETVLAYFQRFLNRFPDVAALAAADQQDVLKLWEGLGYYGRARNLHKAARVVMTEYDGVIPSDPETFRTLPGVGDYICAAVMSIAEGEPLPVVDGNVLRVTARVFGLTDDIARPATRKTVTAILTGHIPEDRPGDFNEAMMELGATVCTPKKPACNICPLSSICVALNENRVHELPVKSRAKATPEHRIVVAVIVDEQDRMLVQQRPQDGLLGGLWEFPGGKVEDGERLKAALQRECKEELGVTVTVGPEIGTIRHAYTHFRILMTAYRCEIESGTVTTVLPTRWITVNQIDELPFPKANHKLFPAIRHMMGGN